MVESVKKSPNKNTSKSIDRFLIPTTKVWCRLVLGFYVNLQVFILIIQGVPRQKSRRCVVKDRVGLGEEVHMSHDVAEQPWHVN